jgi:hypothetical protein
MKEANDMTIKINAVNETSLGFDMMYTVGGGGISDKTVHFSFPSNFYPQDGSCTFLRTLVTAYTLS